MTELICRPLVSRSLLLSSRPLAAGDSTGEHVIGDGAERENIEVLTEVGLVGDGLGCHVGRGRVLDQSIHMRRRRNGLGNLSRSSTHLDTRPASSRS